MIHNLSDNGLINVHIAIKCEICATIHATLGISSFSFKENELHYQKRGIQMTSFTSKIKSKAGVIKAVTVLFAILAIQFAIIVHFSKSGSSVLVFITSAVFLATIAGALKTIFWSSIKSIPWAESPFWK